MVAVLLFGGCDKGKTDTVSTSTSGGRIKLGFIVKQPEEPWFQLEWKFAGQAAAKLEFRSDQDRRARRRQGACSNRQPGCPGRSGVCHLHARYPSGACDRQLGQAAQSETDFG